MAAQIDAHRHGVRYPLDMSLPIADTAKIDLTLLAAAMAKAVAKLVLSDQASSVADRLVDVVAAAVPEPRMRKAEARRPDSLLPLESLRSLPCAKFSPTPRPRQPG